MGGGSALWMRLPQQQIEQAAPDGQSAVVHKADAEVFLSPS
jgi:hypothetical protein